MFKTGQYWSFPALYSKHATSPYMYVHSTLDDQYRIQDLVYYSTGNVFNIFIPGCVISLFTTFKCPSLQKLTKEAMQQQAISICLILNSSTANEYDVLLWTT